MKNNKLKENSHQQHLDEKKKLGLRMVEFNKRFVLQQWCDDWKYTVNIDIRNFMSNNIVN